jgi:hypothetical protein
MQLTPLIITSLTLALAPAGAFAWAQAGDGTWVANNEWYPKVGDCKSGLAVALLCSSQDIRLQLR